MDIKDGDWLADVLTAAAAAAAGGGDGVGMSPKCCGSEEGVHSIRSIWAQDLLGASQSQRYCLPRWREIVLGVQHSAGTSGFWTQQR